jgi:hypothetical protein
MRLFISLPLQFQEAKAIAAFTNCFEYIFALGSERVNKDELPRNEFNSVRRQTAGQIESNAHARVSDTHSHRKQTQQRII